MANFIAQSNHDLRTGWALLILESGEHQCTEDTKAFQSQDVPYKSIKLVPKDIIFKNANDDITGG